MGILGKLGILGISLSYPEKSRHIINTLMYLFL